MGHGIAGKNSISWLNYIAAMLVIIVCGFSYQTAEIRLQRFTKTPVVLPKSFEQFPQAILDWKGHDVQLDENMARAAGNYDFCNRTYINESSNSWVNTYIAYCGRPRTMIGHKPETCYVSAGWIHSSTIKSKFYSRLGREIPCQIHRFYMPQPHEQELVILNFYIINGKASNDENAFSGMAWRTPNIEGDIAYYVAQIQISSILESAVLAAASDLSESIFTFLPDENGTFRILKDEAEVKVTN